MQRLHESPVEAHVRERAGCSEVAVERGDEVFVDLHEVPLAVGDVLYVSGSGDAIDRFRDAFGQ